LATKSQEREKVKNEREKGYANRRWEARENTKIRVAGRSCEKKRLKDVKSSTIKDRIDSSSLIHFYIIVSLCYSRSRNERKS
jgi:hypothetical protein